ncbi:hypothetical protein T07_1775 [Trichinella nelsoni]|uniref:Uncharacterized protein n=1 Tax=Trichinella nelsoni TaxID=6336 RepID=A0A0V0RK96_9BILA|nr:hypothetical protein T07_1775 [Trichinella nelsoni]
MGNFEPFLASSDKAVAASNLPGKILRFDLEQFLSFQTAKQLKKGFSDLILHRIKCKWKKKEVNPGILPFYERNAVLESRGEMLTTRLVNNFFVDHVDQPIVLQ